MARELGAGGVQQGKAGIDAVIFRRFGEVIESAQMRVHTITPRVLDKGRRGIQRPHLQPLPHQKRAV